MSGLWVTAHDSLREIDLDVEIEVAPGETAALVGPSGAGKTTLLDIIAGLRRPIHGTVVANGETWLDTAAGLDLSPDRRSCGYLFQDYALFPHLTAWRNVAFGIEGPRAARRTRAVTELARFGVEHLADVRPGELSGGERQRVALARALVRSPEVLLLDEPLAALDSVTRRHAEVELALAIRDAAAPAVFVTHSFAEAAALSDRVCVVDAGRVIQSGTPASVANDPASGFVADLSGAVVARGAAQPEGGGSRVVLEEGGIELRAADPAEGEVDVAVPPWQISIVSAGSPPDERNVVRASVVSIAEEGERSRVVLSAPRGMAAYVTAGEAREMNLAPGIEVEARWEPGDTRVHKRR